MNLISSFTSNLTQKWLPFHLPSTFLFSTASASSLPPLPRSMSISVGASAATAAPTSIGAAGSGGNEGRESRDILVQYVVLRRDLVDTWPLGSIVTQGCHAAVAAIWSHRDCAETISYLSASNLDSMHKVTLEVKGETQMRNLVEKLVAGGIEHKLWIEQPESIPTCIATRPYPKSLVSSYFKKLKLCK